MKTEIEQRICKIQDKINRLGVKKIAEEDPVEKRKLASRIQSLVGFKKILLSAMENHE